MYQYLRPKPDYLPVTPVHPVFGVLFCNFWRQATAFSILRSFAVIGDHVYPAVIPVAVIPTSSERQSSRPF